MTVLGKILVFVNLVASLATAGLIAMAFTTRTNWATAYTTANSRVLAISNNAKAEVDEANNLVKAMQIQLDKHKNEKVEVVKSVDNEKENLKAKQAELDSVKEALAKAAQNFKDATEELTRRKAEVEAFVARLNERDKKISEIDRRMADLRGEKTHFETSFQVAKDRNEQMRQQIESLKIENSQLRSQIGAGSTQPGSPTGTKVVPPDDVRGTVKRIDGELATISVGSDAGVNVGNSLKIYRLNPPDYLGEVTILAATPQQAVGRISGPKKSQIRVGDEVAANILGK
ncbi:MAG: hypothetical protein U0746_20340 [Gemmataceae bacterium]